ncbi:hypothetical protein PENTCL1PPCAC_16195, partial [Pristionchus entomophagus]
PIISHSESMFSNAFSKDSTVMASPSTVTSTNQDKRRMLENDDDEKSALCLMVSYLNTCIGKAKTSLQRKGINVSSVDANGMPIDFSSRPIDPIFKVARAQLDNERNYMDSSRDLSNSPPKRPHSGHDSTGSPSEKRMKIAGDRSPVSIV